MNSVENYAIRYLEPKDVKDLDQYNALLRYTFQVTEDELTATGWKDEEIKQSKFPVLERADVLGCFDGDTLISQVAVYPFFSIIFLSNVKSTLSIIIHSSPYNIILRFSIISFNYIIVYMHHQYLSLIVPLVMIRRLSVMQAIILFCFL